MRVNTNNPKPVGVISADWHLKPCTWSKYPTLCGDSYRSAKFIVEYCCNQSLPLFLLGDILDRRDPDPVSVGVLSDLMNQMRFKNERMTYFIEGQHERHPIRPWMTVVGGWVAHLHEQSVLVDGINFYGLDYTSPDVLPEKLKNIPNYADIFLAHQVWKERMVRTGDSPADAAFADIPTVPVVISGDFHAHKTTTHTCKDGHEILAVSPGSIYMKSLDEDPNKFFYVLMSDLTFQSVKIPTRPVWRTRINTSEALTKYMDMLVEKCSKIADTDPDKPIWHISYRDGFDDLVARFESAAEGRAHLFLKPIEVTNEEESEEAIESTNEETGLASYLGDCCEPDSAVYNTALRLVKSNNRKEELQAIVSEALAAEEQTIKTGGWETS